MRVRILGSAAGGGFPQWNCACPNCGGLRAGTFRGTVRTQAQLAISERHSDASGENSPWFLIGASPDLRAQIEATPELHPRAAENIPRHSPIAGVVLLNADLDHILGLLLMRELQPLRVHATCSVRRIVTEDNSMFRMLERVRGQLSWTDIQPGVAFSLCAPSSEGPRLNCRALSLGTHYPAYVSSQRQSQLNPAEASLGLIIESPSGKRLAYLPAAPKLDDTLLSELESADVVLFDGTFWSDDELIRIQGSSLNVQTARQMGHVPVSSPEGSMAKLARVRHPRKIYVHVNNTNPMLNEAGAEHWQVREAGWEIAEDGWQFDL